MTEAQRAQIEATFEALTLAAAIIKNVMTDHGIYPHPDEYRQITQAIGRTQQMLDEDKE